jgi:hypothetical protein
MALSIAAPHAYCRRKSAWWWRLLLLLLLLLHAMQQMPHLLGRGLCAALALAH